MARKARTRSSRAVAQRGRLSRIEPVENRLLLSAQGLESVEAPTTSQPPIAVVASAVDPSDLVLSLASSGVLAPESTSIFIDFDSLSLDTTYDGTSGSLSPSPNATSTSFLDGPTLTADVIEGRGQAGFDFFFQANGTNNAGSDLFDSFVSPDLINGVLRQFNGYPLYQQDSIRYFPPATPFESFPGSGYRLEGIGVTLFEVAPEADASQDAEGRPAAGVPLPGSDSVSPSGPASRRGARVLTVVAASPQRLWSLEAVQAAAESPRVAEPSFLVSADPRGHDNWERPWMFEEAVLGEPASDSSPEAPAHTGNPPRADQATTPESHSVAGPVRAGFAPETNLTVHDAVFASYTPVQAIQPALPISQSALPTGQGTAAVGRSVMVVAGLIAAERAWSGFRRTPEDQPKQSDPNTRLAR